jgi:hypothetical protein
MSIAPATLKIATPSQLDDLLDSIGIKLQIGPTAYDEASDRYHTISKLLNKEGNPLARFSPDIYPQGSLRIGTTIKPKGKDEYDLDLVCLLNADPRHFPDATVLLDLVESVLRANKTYDGMIERKNRCIRITYAKQFHMDILPACPSPSNCEIHGEHCLKVPDCNLEDWKDSNPKGYAYWFEAKARSAAATFRKSIEPLPEQQTYQELDTLRRVVQLMKRHRDVALEALELNERPISIVLTTLAARHHTGTTSVIDALESILLSIKSEIELVMARGGKRLVVLNPTNKEEDLSERWDSNPDLYPIFVDWVNNFIAALRALRQQPGLPEISKQLETMFGEKTTKVVIEDYVKRVSNLRSAGDLATGYTTGLIVNKEAPRSTSIQTNNFHGDDKSQK